MKIKKLPTYVELLATAERDNEAIPFLAGLGFEIRSSVNELYCTTQKFRKDVPKDLLLHYRYAMETELAKSLLKHCNGSQTEVALILDMNRGALRHMLKRLDINPWDYK